MPQNAPGYVHRIGRTGRAYNSGASVSLVSLYKQIADQFCLEIASKHSGFSLLLAFYHVTHG